MEGNWKSHGERAVIIATVVSVAGLRSAHQRAGSLVTAVGYKT